jgi:hypothetical protein
VVGLADAVTDGADGYQLHRGYLYTPTGVNGQIYGWAVRTWRVSSG